MAQRGFGCHIFLVHSHPTTIRSEEGLRGRNAMCLCSESDHMSWDIPVALLQTDDSPRLQIGGTH
ncbi:hypothetical protein Pyn_33077 [Prunus yedoensis var. nudiflora]|uniref:Uncharacterized protein n=1 Tax=Prunus yedoensis var. nudiflora TaxID=2094558 RepID=A0A314UR66_PRUYE|nr:hypothetical protein Pyn_33077 [Prunus yedoensis var. nudiflora]